MLLTISVDDCRELIRSSSFGCVRKEDQGKNNSCRMCTNMIGRRFRPEYTYDYDKGLIPKDNKWILNVQNSITTNME